GDGTDQAVDDDAQAPDSEPTEMREGPQTSQGQEVGGDEDDVEWAEGRDVVAEDGDESHRQDARRPYEESQADQLPGESFSPVVAPGTPEEEHTRGQISHQHGGMPENGAEFRTKGSDESSRGHHSRQSRRPEPQSGSGAIGAHTTIIGRCQRQVKQIQGRLGSRGASGISTARCISSRSI